MSATEYLSAIAEATKALPDATKQPDRERIQGDIQSSALALAGHCMDAQYWVMKTQELLVAKTETLAAAQALVAKYHADQNATDAASPKEEPDDSEAHRRQLALGALLSGIMGDDPQSITGDYNDSLARVLAHLVSCALELDLDHTLIAELDDRKAAFRDAAQAQQPATEEPTKPQ